VSRYTRAFSGVGKCVICDVVFSMFYLNLFVIFSNIVCVRNSQQMQSHPSGDESFHRFTEFTLYDMSNNSTGSYVFRSNNFQDEYVSSTFEFKASCSGELKNIYYFDYTHKNTFADR